MNTVDSLPYYDRDLDVVPNLRQRVEREIEEELKIVLSQSQTSNGANQSYHPYLSQYPEPQQSSSKEIHHPLLRVSLPRLSNNRNEGNSDRDNEIREGLDVERFNIPYPNDPTDLEAWERALSNAKAQLEHQKLRSLNLSLMSNYGANHWKLSNFLIEKEIEKVEKTVEAYKLEIDNVNRRRKASQMAVGDQLTDLAQKWQNLISTNISVEITNLNLKAEVDTLRSEERNLKRKLEEQS